MISRSRRLSCGAGPFVTRMRSMCQEISMMLFSWHRGCQANCLRLFFLWVRLKPDTTYAPVGPAKAGPYDHVHITDHVPITDHVHTTDH